MLVSAGSRGEGSNVDGVKGEGQHTEAAPADHGGDSHLCSRTRRVFPKTCPKTFPRAGLKSDTEKGKKCDLAVKC